MSVQAFVRFRRRTLALALQSVYNVQRNAKKTVLYINKKKKKITNKLCKYTKALVVIDSFSK